MKGTMKRGLLGCAVISATVASSAATAGIPVFDALNFASNVVQNYQLKQMRKALTSKTEGTVNFNIGKIDASTKTITDNTKNLLEITTQYNQYNYDIDTSFTWIVKKEGGGEIIPIPRRAGEDGEPLFGDKLDALFAGGAKEHVERFKSAADYGDVMPSATSAAIGSQVRKDANDVLAYSLDAHRAGLNQEAEQLSELIKQSVGKNAQGHGRQLQLANALAGSQANQLVQLRSLMLASETARMAEFEASADREARELATARALRKGLDDTLKSLKTPGADH